MRIEDEDRDILLLQAVRDLPHAGDAASEAIELGANHNVAFTGELD